MKTQETKVMSSTRWQGSKFKGSDSLQDLYFTSPREGESRAASNNIASCKFCTANCIVSPLFLTFPLKLMPCWSPMFGKSQKQSKCKKVSDNRGNTWLEMLSLTWERYERGICAHVTSQRDNFSELPKVFHHSFSEKCSG